MNRAVDRYLALDLGGTKVAVGVVTGEGEVLVSRRALTSELRANGDPLSGIFDLAEDALRSVGLHQQESLGGVGIALPGPVERTAIRMKAAPTIPEIEGVSLTEALEGRFHTPAFGDNDANGAALAEARFGAGRGFGWVAYFTVSTGIGGGMVVDGRVLRGATGTATEFGHQIVLPEGGSRCDCGGFGCLETVSSGRGIARRARERGLAPSDAALVAEQARAGDPTALELWDETALYLGIGISNVINLFDPGVVVLGGGVGVGAADLLLPRVKAVVDRRCMPSLHRPVELRTALLAEETGLIGAACLAMEALER